MVPDAAPIGGIVIDDPFGPLYSVVCTDTNPYGTWQVEFLEHTWLRSGTPGELVRLVGTPAGEKLPRHRTARVVRTSAANRHPLVDVDYAGFNRLFSLHEWLETERPVGTVLILDSDFAFRAPVLGRATPGEVIAQRWWEFGVPDRILPIISRISDGIGSFEPATLPLLIHTSDLRRMMPRWIEVTALIKREFPDFWEVDMFAFVITLREFDLECRYETMGAWMDWPEDFVRGAPIVHYCQPVKARDGQTLWYKQNYAPWDPIDCDPQDAELDYCRDLLTMLDRYVNLRRAARHLTDKRPGG